MNHKTTLSTALLALLLAAPLAAQQSPDQRITEALDRAAAAGLPVALLESKLAEGRAKNIPLDRIAQVVEHRAAVMLRARDVIQRAAADRPVAPDEIAVGADALDAGVPEAMLEQVANTSGQDRRTVAIAALTHLITAGILPDQALSQVQAALARGNEALANLPGVIGRPGAPGGQGGPPSGVPSTGRPPGAGKPPVTPPGGPPGGGGG